MRGRPRSFLALLFTASLLLVPHSSRAEAGCSFQTADQPLNVAFCDTFDAPNPVIGRSGELDERVWGVSRVSGNTTLDSNLNFWRPTDLVHCSGTLTGVRPPDDVRVCNGEVREALNDDDTVIALAMYPKVPFDFAGRTGTVSFDVTNDTHGTHAAWPEFWLTNAPVPAPFTHGGDLLSLPKHGFGIRFESFYNVGQSDSVCPNNGKRRWGLERGSIVVSRDYALDDPSLGPATVSMTPLGCVTASSGPNGDKNHIELRIAQNRIEVWAADAGNPASLRIIGRVDNANLTFTRGLPWIEDAHYNSLKSIGCDTGGVRHPDCQRMHTFAWDNFGFDGPSLGHDLTYDVLDNPGSSNLGWRATRGSPLIKQTLPIEPTDLARATNPSLLFNFYHVDAPLTFEYSINGHAHTGTWPFQSRRTYNWRSIELPIDLSDLAAGPNQVSIGFGSASAVVANINILLRPASQASPPTTPRVEPPAAAPVEAPPAPPDEPPPPPDEEDEAPAE